MSNGTAKTIKVEYLARVEGEGGLILKIKNNKVTDAKLNIFEPPRFFQAFLRGRRFTEAVDITARICGICPIAHQLAAATAMENICGVKVDGQLRELRRLIYYGEWIESHPLHIFLLHAPDFLGYEDAIQLAADHPDVVTMGLRLKKLGNTMMTLIGGREIHPINIRVGGFYKVPTKEELNTLVDELKWAREAALATIQFTSKLEFPDYEADYEFVAIRHPEEYGLIDGRLVSNRGIDIPFIEFEKHFAEEHLQHSNSLHSHVIDRGPYFVGPLARYAVNFDKLTPNAQKAALDAGLGKECYNPFKGIIVRAVETLHAVEESLQIIEKYEKPKEPAVEVKPKAGTGVGITEAPRGIDYHRYSIDKNGIITEANIIAPTAHNLNIIEHDLRDYATKFLDLPKDKLQWQCEQMIRNYDPCISCSCHFLKLQVERE
jgi:sulfhydrogenase subunit alpha